MSAGDEAPVTTDRADLTVDWQAIYMRLRAMVGVTRLRELGVVSTRDCQRFAVACGYDTPDYLAVPETEAVVVPPLMISSVFGWGPGRTEAELRVDGSSPDDVAGLALDGLRLMGAGQSVEWYEPLRSNEPVTMEIGVDDVELKTGRTGQFLVITILQSYRDQAGTMILSCREQFFAR